MAMEEWYLVNISDKTLSPGFLNMRTIAPSAKRDLIGGQISATKDQVRQSDTIKKFLDRKWVKIERMIDNELVDTITSENFHDLFDVPKESLLPKSGHHSKFTGTDLKHETLSTELMTLPESKPKNIENGHYSIYKEGDSLFIAAKDKDGKWVKAVLGKFQ